MIEKITILDPKSIAWAPSNPTQAPSLKSPESKSVFL